MNPDFDSEVKIIMIRIANTALVTKGKKSYKGLYQYFVYGHGKIRIAYPWMAKLVQRFTIFHAMSQSCNQNMVFYYTPPILLLKDSGAGKL